MSGPRMRKPAGPKPVEGSGARRYRTKVEVLRDILTQADPPSSKTGIVRRANLNPDSFDRYLAFCVGSGLIVPTGRRFRRTESGDEAVFAIRRLLTKAEEFGSAVRELGSCVGGDRDESAAPSRPALRFASTAIWDELAKQAARSGGIRMLESDSAPRPRSSTPRSLPREIAVDPRAGSDRDPTRGAP